MLDIEHRVSLRHACHLKRQFTYANIKHAAFVPSLMQRRHVNHTSINKPPATPSHTSHALCFLADEYMLHVAIKQHAACCMQHAASCTRMICAFQAACHLVSWSGMPSISVVLTLHNDLPPATREMPLMPTPVDTVLH